jgi:hypothetical protein
VTTSVTWQRFLGTVAALVFGLVIALAPPTTTASASTYIYDGPTLARIGAHAIDKAGATPVEVSDVAAQSAWPLVTARGTSTTPARSFVATEAAGTRIPWNSYADYPKVTINGREYANCRPPAGWDHLSASVMGPGSGCQRRRGDDGSAVVSVSMPGRWRRR